MGKKILTCLLLIVSGGFTSYAQLISLTGVVSDRKTNTTLPGATVKAGDRGTSTNAAGEFVLIADYDALRKQGFTVSFIGYQKLHIPYNGLNYHIKLTPIANQLPEVVVSGASESILKKAIRKIPENYPDKDFMMEGMVRIIHTGKDSAVNHSYYNSDALVRMHYPSYANKNRKPELEVLSNKDTLISDHKTNRALVHWVNGYVVIPYRDVVHSRTDVLNAGKTSDYNYTLNGKEWLNGHRVYVVNFFAKGKKRDAGTIYIDTVNYAFTRIEMTRYNVTSAVFLPVDKSSWTVNYAQTGDRWHMNTVNITSISKHNSVDFYWTIDYRTTSIDSVNVNSIRYQDVIPTMTEDRKIKRPAPGNNRDKLSTFFAGVAADSTFTRVVVPVIDTNDKLPDQTFLKKAYSSYQRYTTNKNIRALIQVSRLPVSTAGYQPILDETISAAANYSFGIIFQFRLHKKLFFEWDEQFNFGIGGIKNWEQGFYLLYNLEFNKNNHPITISPLTGYSDITLSKGKTTYYNLKSWVSGVNVSYDILHRAAIFATGKYYSPLSNTTTSGFGVSFNNFGLSAGFLVKIK